MIDELALAVVAGAPAEELKRLPLPGFIKGICTRRDEIKIFQGEDDADVRRSLHLDEVPMPALEPDEVVVAIMASALNYNTVWSATFRPAPTFAFLQHFGRTGAAGRRHALDRHVLGSDAAGIVVQVGPSVRHWKVGDEVVINTLHTDHQDPLSQRDGMLSPNQRAWGFETNFGGLADYAVVQATQLMHKPTHLTWEEAASLTLCLMTAYRMLISDRGANVRIGDVVLVWGAAGGLGAFATQLAKAAGCRVAGVVSGTTKADLARRNGCDLVIDRSDADRVHPDGLMHPVGQRWLRKQMRTKFGQDADCVFEHVGRQTFSASVFAAARGGTVVTCGSSTGYEHEFDNRYLWMNLKRIIGSHGANYYESTKANDLVRLGIVNPVVSSVVTLDETAEACRRMQLNEHVGKIAVLSLAPKEGMGVTDHALRAQIGEDRLNLFRSVATAEATN